MRDSVLKLRNNGVHLDILLLCQTFINEQKKNSCLLEDLDYQLFEEHRTNMSRGGVGIYVNKKLNYTERKDLKIFKEGKAESCFIEVKIGKNKNYCWGAL